MGWRRMGEVLAAVLLAHTAASCTVDAASSEPRATQDSAEPGEPEDSVSAQWDSGRALSCEDIRPEALGPSRSFIIRANAPESDCGPGTGNGAGFLALMNSGPFGATLWDIVSRDGVDTGNRIAGGDVGTLLLPQPRGFQNLRLPPGGALLNAYSSDGGFLRSVRLNESRNVPLDVVADPRGDTLVAQWVPRDASTQVLTIQFFDSKGLPRSEPVAVASAPLREGRFVLAGVDTRGRTLLLWPEPARGTWVGQWLKRNGRAITAVFPVPEPTSQAPFGGLKPLAGGGLALQLEEQWVLQFPSGEAEALPAPEWLASHPGSALSLIRGQRANVLVPPPTIIEGSGCQESLLFFASDGTACGELILPFGRGTCSGRPEVGIGLDGTVIQEIALGIPANDQCAWRWWPRLLR